MRLGISINSFYTDSPRDGARQMIERAAAAREADLDSLFLGDHHSTHPESYYQNVPMLGRLLAEWSEKPAGALFLLPLWHPVLLAEQVGTLASIHDGPFIMQTALGGGEQFEAMGVNPRYRPSRFEQCLEAARRLWAGEAVTCDGRYEFENARIAPLPPDGVEVWIAGEADAAIERSARLGDGWMALPRHTTPEAIGLADRFVRARAALAELPPAKVALRRDVYVGQTDEEAQRVVGPILADRSRGAQRGAAVYGSAASVAAQLRELAQAGFTDVIVRSLVAEQSEAVASIHRLAEVRELVRDA